MQPLCYNILCLCMLTVNSLELHYLRSGAIFYHIEYFLDKYPKSNDALITINKL